MKKRTILGLCLSLFSLILFSCGIADSGRGSASFTLDTAKIAQRSVQSANFSEISEEEIFLQYAEYVYFDLSAIVHYEIDGEATDQTFELWSMNGKEAYELVEELQNMSGEDEEAYFVEKFSSQTLTITDLPIGKNATFRLKIRQKVGFNIDLSKYEGLSESEISKDEYLAISKEPVTAKITESTDITIKLTEYSSSLDWEKDSSKTDDSKTEEPKSDEETTEIPWTITGTLPDNWEEDFTITKGEIYLYVKGSNDKWTMAGEAEFTQSNTEIEVIDAYNCGFKGSGSLSQKTLKVSGTALYFREGYTYEIIMRFTNEQTSELEYIFMARSNDVKISKDSNAFEMTITYEQGQNAIPAPETIIELNIQSSEEITAKYATVEISTATASGEIKTILSEDIELDSFETSSGGYIAVHRIDDTSVFEKLEEGTMLYATLTLYEDEAMEKQANELQGYLDRFYEKCVNVFSFYISDSSSQSEQTSSLEIRLFDETGTDAISLEDTTYYYALMITAEAADDITSVTPLHAEVSPTNTININLSGTQIADVISKGTVYFTFALFESQDDANSFIKTGELGNAKYFVTNQEVTFSSTTSPYESVILKLSPQA